MSEVADDAAVWYYERGSEKLVREDVPAGGWLRWLYHYGGADFGGRLLFHNSIPSRIIGAFMRSPLSRSRIEPAIAAWGLNTAEFARPLHEFGSFNDFFTRHLVRGARPFSPHPENLCAPADGRLLVTESLEPETRLPVKGAAWRVDDLLGRHASDFHGGAAALLRLAPADYHRFHFPAAGQVREHYDVPGTYHSVNPMAVASGAPAYRRNHRHVWRLTCEVWGEMALVAVGAFAVGRIAVTHHDASFAKMDELGYFEFGGSSLVLLLPAGRCQLRDALLRHSAEGYETRVQAGDIIATLPA